MSQVPVAVGEVVQAAANILAIGPEDFFMDRKHPLPQVRRFPGTTLVGIDIGKVVQTDGRKRMIGPNCPSYVTRVCL